MNKALFKFIVFSKCNYYLTEIDMQDGYCLIDAAAKEY